MADLEAAKREILEWVAGTIQVPAEQIDVHKPLPELGLDSYDAVHLVATIEAIIQQEVDESVVQQVACLNDIFDLLAKQLSEASQQAPGSPDPPRT